MIKGVKVLLVCKLLKQRRALGKHNWVLRCCDRTNSLPSPSQSSNECGLLKTLGHFFILHMLKEGFHCPSGPMFSNQRITHVSQKVNLQEIVLYTFPSWTGFYKGILGAGFSGGGVFTFVCLNCL